MGLDMYVYKVSMLTKEEIAEVRGYKNSSEVDSDKYSIIRYDEQDMDMLWDIIPYAVRTTMDFDYIDTDAIRKDNHLPFTCKVFGSLHAPNEVTYTFHDADGNVFNITTPRDVIKEKYIISKPNDVLVFKPKEVAYWRKAYDLQTKFYDIYNDATGRCIQNCGYHRMTDSMIDVAMDDGEADLPMLRDGEALFYWEWYQRGAMQC